MCVCNPASLRVAYAHKGTCACLLITGRFVEGLTCLLLLLETDALDLRICATDAACEHQGCPLICHRVWTGSDAWSQAAIYLQGKLLTARKQAKKIDNALLPVYPPYPISDAAP